MEGDIMSEYIDVFTEDGEKIRKMTKQEYYLSVKKEDMPWIKCSTCFVIDNKNKKILFEIRGKTYLDPGELDLCSGHVRTEETPKQCIIRELKEELSLDVNENSNIQYLGNVNYDYTKSENENIRKNFKSFVSVFAFKIEDISQIIIDENETVGIEWKDFDETINCIKNKETRIPYDEEMKNQYELIFDNLKKYIFD
jgi:8-oxo-dGTP pyrophosphatase MutT (NUDIX family)